MRRTHRRRGVTLAIVVIVMGLVGGLIALLAWHSAHLHQQRQAERVRLVCAQVARSAASYAQIQGKEWAATPATQPVELDVRAIVPSPLVGKATLGFSSSEKPRVCHIVATVEGTTYSAQQELDVPLLATVAPVKNSQPATQP